MIKSLNSFLVVILLSILSFQAQSQVFYETDGDTALPTWGGVISPYALLASQSTDVGGERIRQSFSDLSSITNTGFQIAGALRYKRFILSSDLTYALLQTNQQSAGLTLDMRIQQYIVDTKLGYLIHHSADFSQTNEVIRGWSLEANIGWKYWQNDVNVKYIVDLGFIGSDTGSIVEPQKWNDLMIGVKSRIILNRKVTLGLTGDIGGFGIGNSSKLSYDFSYTNTFKVLDFMYITAGFRSFRYRRVDGEPGSELETTVSVLGPLLGVSFGF